MDVTQADIFNSLRGYADWTGSPVVKTAAILRAMDYIAATYNLRDILTASEQSRLDSATALLARDMLNSTSATIRATAAITKEAKEGVGFKKSVEYADAPTDLYPYISVLLNPLCVPTDAASYSIGKLVRG